MSHTLPPLPYAKSALEPYMSGETVECHYSKHHRNYCDTFNKLVINTTYANITLEEVISDTHNEPRKLDIFNNAAQFWNHNFFWNSMCAAGTSKLSEIVLNSIIKDFGSTEGFKEQFKEASARQFGSGWVWLVQDKDKLIITATSNANNPLTHKQKPLLTCDVWEHAYYLDYKNRRTHMVQEFLDKLINWSFVETNLQSIA